MSENLGTTGLIFNEPLLWEKGAEGRAGFSLPRRDVEEFPIDGALVGDAPEMPELSEVDVVRHYTRLSQWNFGIDSSLYPLGSCTMKYNPKVHERLAGLRGFAGAHPLLPPERCQGALALLHELEGYLAEITGMDATSLQPAAGAHGELTGLLVLRSYLNSRGERRTKILVPDTAHGTNPASAALCGFEPIVVKSSERGILSPADVAAVMDEGVAGIMVTNPNTLGFFEEDLKAITELVHAKGGQVYCDGANLNAVMGIVQMGALGVDVMHLNLHKTFSTPHGGGGPGSGPICVKKHLEPFLPVPRIVRQEGGAFELDADRPASIGKIHAFYGNFGVMVKAYSYIRSLGPEDLEKASQLAVLNANYLREKLKGVFHLPYDRPCMHECVFTDEGLADHGVTTLDVAKRLMDYGFHPPTIYFPLVVHGALMIEPTETESLETIDQFIAACTAIAEEARSDPERLRQAPSKPKLSRLDETRAARNPCLRD